MKVSQLQKIIEALAAVHATAGSTEHAHCLTAFASALQPAAKQNVGKVANVIIATPRLS
jgi:hypothetical protein